ncbi:MAG TPA: HD-GYP domain-containing protein [Candidatus Baltobacteraceae bacterium]|nr:HD-GYP domain-containing protein [Candidatus Baltobacteraceae bacterium]
MQFGFVARFAAVLLVVVIGVSAVLSFLFAGAHLNALKNDLIANAVGQASATLQPALEKYAKVGSFTETDRRNIDNAVRNIENFQPLVLDVRIYQPSGLPLDPILAPNAAAYVKRAVAEQNIVQSPEHRESGEAAVTVFVPLAAGSGGSYLAVAAVDVSVGQLNAQTNRETQFVVVSTVVACAVIFLSLLTLAAAAQRELNRRREAAEKTFLQTMEGIATIVDQRDPYTAGHSRRVSEYAVAIARHLKLRDAEVERVRWSALLHDLGKIGVPDAVLLKDGPLDPSERQVISAHPTIAAAILGPVQAMAEITPCVLHHHERWDGGGYPAGLRGDAIPFLARVIAVADTFDAMTTNRPYRVALEVSEARRRLLEGGGVQWDARCINAMVELIDAQSVAPPAAQMVEFGRRLGAAPSA